MAKEQRTLDIFACEQDAPLLHLQIYRLRRDMPDIFEHRVVREFFLFLLYVFAENPAWDEDEVPEPEIDPVEIARNLKWFKDLEHEHLVEERGRMYSVYSSLCQAVGAIRGQSSFPDLFNQLPELLADDKISHFLAVVSQIAEIILEYEADAQDAGPSDVLSFSTSKAEPMQA